MTRNRFMALLTTLFLLLVPSLPAAAAPQVSPPPALAGFSDFVTAAMKDWQVPGLAVGIVKDGQVIYLQGFGQRDLERSMPVTADTLFPIGTGTKAFTALAFQSLVEDGTLDWDTPVRQSLPNFHTQDPYLTEHITPRDWALHRTGLEQIDIPFFFNQNIDLNAFNSHLDALTVKPDFRTRYADNNLGEIMLAQVMEHATGRPWAELVQARILQPLGMQHVAFGIPQMQQYPDYAHGYRAQGGRVVRVPYQEWGQAGPAGGINASAAEMVKWAAMQLNEGQPVVSAIGLTETHTPQITVSGRYDQAVSYALGWKAETFRGHSSLVEGGSAAGFASLVSLYPQDGLGVVVLSNAEAPELPKIVTYGAVERLLGLSLHDWNGQFKQAAAGSTAAPQPANDDFPPGHTPAEHTGTYEHPLYGTLTVTGTVDGLRVLYGTASILLKHERFEQFSGPLDERFPYNVPFRFELGPTGDIDQVLADFGRQGIWTTFTRQPNPDLSNPSFLEQMAGTYESGGQVVTVVRRGSQLALVMPDQAPALLVPDGVFRFHLKEAEGVAVEFVLNVRYGRAIKLTITRAGYPAEFLWSGWHG